MCVALIFGIWPFFIDLKEGKWESPYPIFVARLSIALFFSLGFFQKITHYIEGLEDKIRKRGGNFKKGRQGERMVQAELEKIFSDTRHKIYPNLQIEGQKADCDFVILSQQGLTLLEVKNWSQGAQFGPYGKLIGSTFKNPQEQLLTNAQRMRDYLSKAGLNIPIHRALVFTGGKASYSGKQNTWIVNEFRNLKAFFTFNDQISLDDFNRLNDLLRPV